MTAGKGARGVDGGRESPPESAGLQTAVKRWGRVGKVNKLVEAFECRTNDQPAIPTEESMISSSPRRARKEAPFPSPVNVVDFNDAVQVQDSASPVDEKRFAFQGARNARLKFGEETRQDEFKSQDQDKGSQEREDGQSINPNFAGSTSSGAAKNINADGVENLRTIGVQRYVDRQTAAMKVEERNERQDHTIPRAYKSVTLEFVKKIDRKHDYRTNGERKSAKANEKASSSSESESKEKVAKHNERVRSPRETLVHKEVANRNAVTTENSGCTRGHVEPTADAQGQGGELSSSPIAVKDISTCELAEAQSPSFEAALVSTKVGVVSGGQHDVAICGRLNLADHAQEYASKSVSKSVPDTNQVKSADVEKYLDGGSKVAPGGLTNDDMNNIGIRRRVEASDFKRHVSPASKANNAAGSDEGTLPQEGSECKIPEAEKMTPSSKGRKTRTDRTPKPVSSVASRKNDLKLQIVLDGFQKCKLINETLSQENQALKERLEMAESRTGALENEKTLAMKGIAEALQDRENMITTLEQRAGILSKEVKQTHDRYEAQIKFLRGENRSEVEKWKALHNNLEKQLRSSIQEHTDKVRSLEETLQTKDVLLKKLVDESEEAKIQHKNEIECFCKDIQRKQDALEEIESELKDQLIGLEKSKREEINELQLSLNSQSGAVKALESDLAIERLKTSTLQSDIKQAVDYFTVNLGQCKGAEQLYLRVLLLVVLALLVHATAHKDHVWETLRNEAKKEGEREPLLVSFLFSTILNHDSLESALAFHLANRLSSPAMISTQVMSLCLEALQASADFRKSVREDMLAGRERDPACTNLPSVFLYFKGFHALQTYRVAHYLWQNGRQVLAQYLQSQMSQVFQIDIHPNATLGSGLMLDHGTGIVIGETAVVGYNCSILHHVTLGGSGKKGVDRHPKIGDSVLIGAGASILGNIRVGNGCQIGAGTLVIADLPDHTVAVGVPAKSIIGSFVDETAGPSQDMNQVGTKEFEGSIARFSAEGI